VSDRILLVEDDSELGAQVVQHLTRAGFDVTWRKDGDEARREDPAGFSLLDLDLMLPGTYGMDLLKIYRQKSDVPVLILSARDDTTDKVRALRLGADDYVTKPFWPEELVARVSARLRRPNIQRGAGPVRVGDLVLDLDGRVVEVAGSAVELTRVEFDILAALARRKGSALSRDALMEAALDPDKLGTPRTLDVHVSRLRKKLGPAGAMIATVWGIGYRLEEPKGTEP